MIMSEEERLSPHLKWDQIPDLSEMTGLLKITLMTGTDDEVRGE